MDPKNNDLKIEEQPRPPATKQCRYCASIIASEAKICIHCKQHQRAFFNYFRVEQLLLLISLGISLILIVINYYNYREAKEERIKASEALEKVSQAQKRVDQLNALMDKGNSTIEILNKQIKRADQEIQNFRKVTDVEKLFFRANSDDRFAFDKLIKMSQEAGPFQERAKQATFRIAVRPEYGPNVFISMNVNWRESKINPNTASLEDLKREYPNVNHAFRPSFLSAVWDQNRFSKYERLDFLYEVIKKEESLAALARACVLMARETKSYWNILGYHLYLQWWENNKHKYK